MFVKDIWGDVRFNKKFIAILESKEFKSLKDRNQLGFNIKASHKRYDHSIGTFFVASRLVEICEEKFGDILTITEEDKNAVLIMALIHDIGHSCYSHGAEEVFSISHEERAIEILLSNYSEVNKAIVNNFSKEVLDKVINLIRNQKDIKKNKGELKSYDLSYVVGKLLSGGIDVDRIDYIYRDSFNINREENNFISMLDAIDLEFIDGSLEIVFDDSAEYTIANFLNKRFEMYDEHYFGAEVAVIEEAFKKFLKFTNKKISYDTTQIEMENYFREMMNCDNETISNYAEILSSKELCDDYIIKEFSKKSDFDNFKEKIYGLIPELYDVEDAIVEVRKNINIYSAKNKIYLRKNGLIEDLSKCSQILNSDLVKEKCVFCINIELAFKLLEEKGYPFLEIMRIMKRINKYTSPEIEQEIKYEFDTSLCEHDILQVFNEIKSIFNLNDGGDTINVDQYFDDASMSLHNIGVNLRKRESDEEREFTLKSPLEDSTSYEKRNEVPFHDIELAKKYISEKWDIQSDDLNLILTLVTERNKFQLEVYGGVFELVFDKSYSVDKNNVDKPFYTIECEYKSGKTIGLHFINEVLKKNDMIYVSKLSKKEIALNNLNKCSVRKLV